MPRIDGPTRDDITRRGDELSMRMVSAIWHTLNSVTSKFTGTVTLDDIASIHTVWKTYVPGLRDHIGQTYLDGAAQTREQQRDALVQILKRNDAAVTAALVAAAGDEPPTPPFEIPLVANQRAETIMAEAENRLTNVGNEVWEHARGELVTGLQNGEGIPDLRDRVSAATDLSAARAEVIARTEIAGAMNAGALDQMRQIDTPGMIKEWIGTDDGRERPEHVQANGERITLDGVFSNGLDPGEEPNCRCTYGFDIPNEVEEQFATDTCGCDSPALSSLVASAARTTFASQDAEWKAWKKRMAERDAARAKGEDVVVPAPQPKVAPPTPRAPKTSTLQRAVQTLKRDESLASPCACNVVTTDEVTGRDALAAAPISSIKDIDDADELSAVRKYKAKSTNITGSLREHDGNLADILKREGGATGWPKGTVSNIERIDSAMSRSPLRKGVSVTRGVTNPKDNMSFMWSNTKSIVGAEWRDEGFVSTSVSEQAARDFLEKKTAATTVKNMIMHLHVPPGVNALGLSSASSFEAEMLLDRGLTYTVTADRGWINGVREIDVAVRMVSTETSAGDMFASKSVYDDILRQATEKIANAPVPSKADIKKAQIELANARAGTGRAGGEARGGSAADRRKQRQNLFKEFGGDDRGYIVCHGCGMKIHWADPGTAENPHGYARFERGKIFVKCQGGGYQLLNLLPECFACNRSRNDQMIRLENKC